ncbi:MAG: outer membrane beta-barrel protein [Rhodospirillales bacterium]|nr:outer membrane beta-barrel protein [Rhodospirillales bacterium]
MFSFSRHFLPVAMGLAALSLPAMVMADDGSSYIAGSAGLSLPRDMDLDGGSINSSVDLETGPAGVISIGTGLMENVRGEFELGFRSNDADSISGASASGDTRSLSAMVNGFYDFDTGNNLTPYIGFGLGAARVTANGISPVSGTRVDDADTGFAYQGIVGASYELNANWMATADYRYFSAPNLDFRSDSGTGLDSNYDNHTFMIGLRFNFSKPKTPTPLAEVAAAAPEPTPPPAVVEPAQPVVARSYIVFFDWDHSDLQVDAKAILAQTAANAQLGGISSIVTTGHADRSGTDQYNLKLSKRRAESVQAELVRLGVPMSEIAIDWKGEHTPLVPTDDGIREPQNRRVEIVFP